MTDKRYQFVITGPAGSAVFETDDGEVLRQVGEVLKAPSVSRVSTVKIGAGRPKKPVYILEAPELFSIKAGTAFPDSFAAAKALDVSALTVRQALYVARKQGLSFAKVKNYTLSYDQSAKIPSAEDAEADAPGKRIIVLDIDPDSPHSQLQKFDQFPSASVTCEILGVGFHAVTQALYAARKKDGSKQAKVKGVTLSYLEDYASEHVRD